MRHVSGTHLFVINVTSPTAGLILSYDKHMRATKTAIRTLTLMPNCHEETLLPALLVSAD
jgi:hypothetical protein